MSNYTHLFYPIISIYIQLARGSIQLCSRTPINVNVWRRHLRTFEPTAFNSNTQYLQKPPIISIRNLEVLVIQRKCYIRRWEIIIQWLVPSRVTPASFAALRSNVWRSRPPFLIAAWRIIKSENPKPSLWYRGKILATPYAVSTCSSAAEINPITAAVISFREYL